MPKIVYEGPIDAVTLVDGTRAERGKAVDVSDEIADRYLSRPDFTRARKSKTKDEE